MTLNGKTKIMAFGRNQGTINVTLYGSQLDNVTTMRYLGVVLDPELNFQKHVDYICGKAKSAFNKLACLLKSRKGIPPTLGLQLFKALVRPHLELQVGCWGFKVANHLTVLRKTQDEFLRRLCGAFKNSSREAVRDISSQ